MKSRLLKGMLVGEKSTLTSPRASSGHKTKQARWLGSQAGWIDVPVIFEAATTKTYVHN